MSPRYCYLIKRNGVFGMNWSKAKTILIVVFLIADIFLLYESYLGPLALRMARDKENTKEIVDYLEKQGISVKSAIPKPGSSKAALDVKYKYFNEQYAMGNFFDGLEDVDVKNYDDRIVMENKDIYVEINGNVELIYTNKALIEGQTGSFDEGEAQKKMEAFLKKMGINQKDRYSGIKKMKNGYLEMSCSQGYKGTFLDRSCLEIQATDKGVVSMKMLWFETVNNGKAKKEVISPVNALMKLSELYKDDEQNIIVLDMSLGYYFNTDVEDVKEFDVTTVKEGTAIPVWKVITDKGRIYINAYNGIVEKN